MEQKTTDFTYAKLTYPEPIGYLEHEATHSCISVYKKINAFQAFMMRICFGLKYIKTK